MPLFPPDTFDGFEVASAVQDKDTVRLEIFMEAEVKLTPFRAGDDIWVQLAK